MDTGPDGSRPEVMRRLEAARQEFAAQARRFEEAKSRLAETSDISRKRRTQPNVLYQSAFARLQARLDTMPVVEQAKGILMAEHQCGPEEAFDLLRRASQLGNVKVNVLAEQIVARLVAPGTGNGSAPGTGNGRKPRPLTDSVSRRPRRKPESPGQAGRLSGPRGAGGTRRGPRLPGSIVGTRPAHQAGTGQDHMRAGPQLAWKP